jgi:hypothetical protein
LKSCLPFAFDFWGAIIFANILFSIRVWILPLVLDGIRSQHRFNLCLRSSIQNILHNLAQVA